MTNKEKIEILLKMRERIERGFGSGFCHVYAFVTNSGKPSERELNEIGLFKPEKPFDRSNCGYWYDTDDKKTRIEQIDKAIASFEKLEQLPYKLKEGDKVKVISSNLITDSIGKIFTVKEVFVDSIRLSNGWYYNHYDVELVNEQTTLETLEAQKAEIEKRIAEMKSDKIDLWSYYKGKTMFTAFGSKAIDYHLFAYPTKHTAEKALLMIKLTQIAYILNGGDWSAEYDEAGYALLWNREENCCFIQINYSVSHGLPLFKTRESAERAKKQFTADELKKLLS